MFSWRRLGRLPRLQTRLKIGGVTMQPKTCTECKVDPVRQVGKYLCYSCFEKALRDLLRSDDGERK